LDALDFVVDRDDLDVTRVVPAEVPDASSLGPGAVLVEIEKFGFSANNITYASLGETMRYWEFFPRADGRGRVPVWGYARVVASEHDEIAQGERLFGYLPMSTHVVLESNGRPERHSAVRMRTSSSCRRGWSAAAANGDGASSPAATTRRGVRFFPPSSAGCGSSTTKGRPRSKPSTDTSWPVRPPAVGFMLSLHA